MTLTLLDAIGDDTWRIVLQELGTHYVAMRNRGRTRRVCKFMRDATDTFMPVGKNASILVHPQRQLALCNSFDCLPEMMKVYDVRQRCMKQIVMWYLIFNPNGKTWYYWPEDLIIWKVKSAAVKSAAQMVCTSALLYSSEMREERFTIASGMPITCDYVPPCSMSSTRGRRQMYSDYPHVLQSLYAQVLRSLSIQINHTGSKSLVWHHFAPQPASIDYNLLGDSLRMLKVVELDNLVDFGFVASHACNVEALTLGLGTNGDTSKVYRELTSCEMRALMELIIRWREQGTMTTKSLIFKEPLSRSNLYSFVSVLYDTENDLELIDKDKNNTRITYLFCSQDESKTSVALTTQGNSSKEWWTVIRFCELNMYCQTLKPFNVTLRTEAVATPSRPASLIVPPNMPARKHQQQQQRKRRYVNPVQEQDRYMWQWQDFTCPTCGAEWPKHSVTISQRQTFASKCLHRNGRCEDRAAFKRVQAKELWITDSCVVGNGGNDLTPHPTIVLEQEALGQLVAIDPEALASMPLSARNLRSLPYKYFKIDPTNPGRKIPV